MDPFDADDADDSEADADADGARAQQALGRARELVDQAQRIVVLTGAGISTDSGIPDFRGKDGVWTRNPEAEKLATIDHYLASADTRRRSWQWRLESGMFDRRPNAGHRALVHLERRGKLDLLITQNVDGLHHQAGSDPERVVEVHGTVRDAVCVACGWRGPIGPVLDRVRAGEDDPPCEVCGGIVKTATVMFGEGLDRRDLLRSMVAAERCDLLLAVGTTLAVGPINEVVPRAAFAGARVVILNRDPTELEELADVVVRASISDALPVLVGEV